jgi:hypothetical protein
MQVEALPAAGTALPIAALVAAIGSIALIRAIRRKRARRSEEEYKMLVRRAGGRAL